MTIKVNGEMIKGLTYTRADVSVISYNDWPPKWNFVTPEAKLRGLGTPATVHQSKDMLSCVGPEGKTSHFKPYIVDIPITLWGMDLLAAMKLKSTTENFYISDTHDSSPGWKLMKNIGHQEKSGLGKNCQGITEPINLPVKHDRYGVVFDKDF